MKKLLVLLFVTVLSVGLVGCGGNAVDATDQAPQLNLEDYADIPAGEVWVVLEDGTVDKFQNGSGGMAYGVDYFLKKIANDEAYYEERYEGATYVVHCQVKSTKKDYLTRSGDRFDTALELTSDRGYLKANGKEPATCLIAEVDGDSIKEQEIKSDDSVIVASQKFDFRFDNLYAPTEVLKAKKNS